MLTDVFQPLLGKAVQIAPQLGDPPAGFRVHLLIDWDRPVLPEGQRFQRSFVPVYPEGHLRVTYHISVVDIGVADRDFVRADPLQMQGHHALPIEINTTDTAEAG